MILGILTFFLVNSLILVGYWRIKGRTAEDILWSLHVWMVSVSATGAIVIAYHEWKKLTGGPQLFMGACIAIVVFAHFFLEKRTNLTSSALRGDRTSGPLLLRERLSSMGVMILSFIITGTLGFIFVPLVFEDLRSAIGGVNTMAMVGPMGVIITSVMLAGYWKLRGKTAEHILWSVHVWMVFFLATSFVLMAYNEWKMLTGSPQVVLGAFIATLVLAHYFLEKRTNLTIAAMRGDPTSGPISRLEQLPIIGVLVLSVLILVALMSWFGSYIIP